MNVPHCDRCRKEIITESIGWGTIGLDSDAAKDNHASCQTFFIDLCPTCYAGLVMYLCKHNEPMGKDLRKYCAEYIQFNTNGKQIDIEDIVKEIENE